MTLKTAIIGIGRIAGGFEDTNIPLLRPCTHAGAYEKCIDTTLIAVCDIDLEKAKAFSLRWNCLNVYSDYKDLLLKEDIDILSICTDSKTHFEIVKFACENKKKLKVIWCEKPLAYTLAEAEQMVEMCQRQNIALTVNNRRRWDHHYYRAIDLIDDGAIGKLYAIEAICPSGLLNSGTHLFDIMEHLVDSKIYAVVGRTVFDDSNDPGVCGTVYFENGIIGLVDCAWKENYIFSLRVRGEKGELHIAERASGVSLFKVNEQDYPTIYQQSQMYRAVENIVHYIKKEDGLRCYGDNGLRPMWVALAFKISEERGGQLVNLQSCLDSIERPLLCRKTSFTKDGNL